MEISISVIIPVYNRVNLLPDTLNSLLNQTVSAFEIIVVDDGSTDGTAEVAEAFGSPVKVIRQENRGPAAARNRGFLYSSGEFIHFFDSDDIALPNKHEIQYQDLEKSGADISYSPWVKGRFTDRGFQASNAILQQKGLPDGDLVKALLTNWSIVTHACLFRRSIVEKVGGFPEEISVAEDQLMFLRCLLAGARVIHSPRTMELYRTDNPGKLTSSNSNVARQVYGWSRFLVEAAKHCLEYGIDASDWLGFRRRVWEAHNDLIIQQIDIPELNIELSNLAKSCWPNFIYMLEREWHRKRMGLSMRLGKGRAHPCFKSGPINASQEFSYKQWLSSRDHI